MISIINYFILALSTSWVLFQFYLAAFAPYPAMIQRPVHLGFALALAFLIKPINEKKNNYRILDIILSLLALSVTIYLVTQYNRIELRYTFIDEVKIFDKIGGIILILLILEACRRLIGNALVILSMFFLLYSFFGPYFPGLFRHSGINLVETVDLQILSLNGIFGMAIGVSTNYIFYFIVFAAFLSASGVSDLLMDGIKKFKFIRNSAYGPAMIAVIGSSLMGTISGSATANASATGAITIPMMKKIGYSPVMAGAIEAAASTGGQLMPPIMGASIFIMAEILGKPYWELAMIGFLPAILFYFVISIEIYQHSKLISIDQQINLNIGLKKDSILSRLPLLIPLFYLIYCIFSGYSLMSAAFRSTIFLLIISIILKKRTEISLSKIVEAAKDATRSASQVAVVCAASGIIVGSVLMSGLNLRFPSILITLSGGNLLFVLFFSMIGLIIMGMGLPTVGAYIMGAIIFAPALTDFGINRIAAHYFVFYFGVVGLITPPVAVTAYAAASIAHSNFMKTGIKAFQLSIAAFLIPYIFVYNPALLLQGTFEEIIRTIIIALISSMFFTIGISGYMLLKKKLFTRVLLSIGGFFIAINQNYLLSILVGLILLLILYFDRKSGSIAKNSVKVSK